MNLSLGDVTYLNGKYGIRSDLSFAGFDVDGKFIIPELSQLESQLNSDSVVFSDKGVEVSFEIKVQDKVGNEFLVDYKYTKTFINKPSFNKE